jgi:hypothetical protein
MEQLQHYSAKILIIGVNPYVLIPATILKIIFKQANKSKGAIQVRGTIDGHPYIQTLVRYSGKWRLYLNTPMRKSAKKDVGDIIEVRIEFDPVERIIPLHPKFLKALALNKKAKKTFESLSPSRQKEIVRYISSLKNEDSRDRNITRAIGFLSGKGRFVGRDKP